MKRVSGFLAAMAVVCGTVGEMALAQGAADFPRKTVQIIVPTPAGGPSDTAARQVAQALSVAWGQQVIVENKPGALGAIAAQAVLGARADGHTLLWAQGSMVGLPMVQKNAPYRSLGEFAPVVNVLQFGYAMFANKDVPFKTFNEFVAYGKANPGKLNFATGTLGEYMTGAQVLKAVGVQAERVPYKGGAQLMPDLIGGQVQINFGPIQSGISYVKAGKLRMLVTLLPRRSSLMPDVPTAGELGVALGNIPSWNGIFAPPGTTREITEKIASAVNQALKAPALRAALEQQGAEPLGGTPQQLADAVVMASDAWKSFVNDYAIPQE
jgi:tripartite-type tricarboxylate transporter receptor subunit TctC